MALALRECCPCNCNGSEWKVQLAQFVPPPPIPADKRSLSPFKPLTKRFFPTSGSWISSRSPAILTLSTANSATKLYVKLHGEILEEHLISRLKLTWPQTSCQALKKFGTSGSRVVFASYYKECLHKGFGRSKFALRFETALHARDFLSSIQDYGAAECSFPQQETQQASQVLQAEAEISRSIIPWDESSASELLAVHKPQANAKNEGVPTDKSDTQKQEMNCSIKVDHSQDPLEQQAFSNQVESNYAELPPRFSSYLQECRMTSQTVTDEGKIESPHNLQMDPSDVKASTHDLKAQVTACFMDPSFQDFVSKVDKVWQELNVEMMEDI